MSSGWVIWLGKALLPYFARIARVAAAALPGDLNDCPAMMTGAVAVVNKLSAPKCGFFRLASTSHYNKMMIIITDGGRVMACGVKTLPRPSAHGLHNP